ncbi:MAG TPA: flagellar basal-body rod protein FlgG [Firmicutes bacterium]|jgi:flagellar basal-body rod protein FlgG|nr:flagellar basal-body rod protein FlgG [Bacillota bacterium]
MMRALWSASSGMLAQQLNIDVISHNLSNVNTNGFKKSRLEFQDLLYETIRGASPTADGGYVPSDLSVGHGVRPSATLRIFSTGNLQLTQNPLDVAIEGDGFFVVELPSGEEAYTRDGSFKLDADGDLVTTDGYLVMPGINIPPGAKSIVIAADGTISYELAGDAVTGDQITLAQFPNPAGLRALGRNLFLATEAAGPVEDGLIPGEDCGSLASGYIELSNVQVVEEMVNMITAQRAYEINAKAITAADEMLGVANNLRR